MRPPTPESNTAIGSPGWLTRGTIPSARPVAGLATVAHLEAGAPEYLLDRVRLAREQARADEPARHPVPPGRDAGGDLLQKRSREVGDHRLGQRRHLRAEVRPDELELDPVGPAFSPAASIDASSLSHAEHRPPPELGGGDGQHAGSGAQIDSGAARLAGVGELHQQLDRHAGRRMRAGPEGLAGIDGHDAAPVVDLVPLEPRRAYQDAVGDQNRLVKVAPAVGPVVGDLLRGDRDRLLAGQSPRPIPGPAARRVPRRSRTRPSPGRAPPRLRQARPRRARRARSPPRRGCSGPRA